MPTPHTDAENADTPRRRRRRLRLAVQITAASGAVAVGGLALLSCAVRPPAAGSIDGVGRLDGLNGPWPDLSADVQIGWDQHLIPSIEAGSDADAAFAMGVVHAHLRLAQMELFRRVSQGRLAEMAGPIAAGVDEAIRAIDLARAVPDMEAALPAETALWLSRYVAGINAYRDRLDERPADARTLGIRYDEAPWTVRDVLTFGRLASVDVNWGRWLVLAGLRDEPGYDDFVRRLWAFGDAGLPSFSPDQPHDLDLLTDIGRTGSNAFVVAGRRSASGGALVAGDPHLGLPQPNIWCVVGYRTPDHAAVGLTIPGLPFILIGRNQHIAWTGTNMQSTSSVLYRLPEGWKEARPAREEHIGVRWWFDRTAEIRESAHGPVITDAKLLRRLGDGDVAFRWRGHQPSDEATAFLNAGRASDWDAFRRAFATYAVSGQNMLYGDADGRIGQVMAVEAIPAAAAAGRLGPVDPADQRFAWGPGVPSDRLPAASDPEAGFLASANNIPTRLAPALVPQGNANDRMQRMNDLLSGDGPYTLDDLAAIQRDTYSGASRRVAGRLIELLSAEPPNADAGPLLGALDAWDGRYEADSTGAAAYQIALHELIDALYTDRYGPKIRRTMRSAPYVHAFLLEDLDGDAAGAAASAALARAARTFGDGVAWGELHRLRLAHPIGAVPLIGRAYVFDEAPQSGSTTTIYKSAHAVTNRTHRTTFGANARILFDMGGLDDNRVVLLGGQDGWLGSDRLLDQAELWRTGEYAPLPLSKPAQQARAVRTTTLNAAPSPD